MKYYIYQITNTINGKVYIGQTKNPKQRWSRHKSDARLSKNKGHLYRAISKYGEYNFVFKILQEVESLKEADLIETLLILQHKSCDKNFGYNKAPGGQGKRVVSDETRKKISESRKGKCTGEDHYMWGRHHSEETKQKIRTSQLGNKHRLGFNTSEATKNKLSKINIGKIVSDETKKKMSKSMIGKNIGPKNGMFGVKSQHHPLAKLTFEQAQNIRYEYNQGNVSSIKLADKYDVSKKTILNIINNKIYTKP